MSGAAYKLDIALLGGGIAGLWLLNHFCSRGYHCALFSNPAIGGLQTLASQGMIHAGTKYALDGQAKDAGESSRLLAGMPARWSACLRGRGDIDLRQTRLLSPHHWLWARGAFNARAQMLLAGGMFQSHIERAPAADYPAVFMQAGFKGELYRMLEPVVDSSSLVANLANNHPQRILGIDPDLLHITVKSAPSAALLHTGRDAIEARQVVLCAGAGNETLLRQLGAGQPQMQRRALRQVMVRHASLPPLYGHWLDASRLPRLTISSHDAGEGQWLWYLGGKLAETGAHMSENDAINLAQSELHGLFPKLKLDGASWSSLLIDRAEPRQADAGKPADVFCEPVFPDSPVLVAWPTKLSLAPALATQAESMLQPPSGVDTQLPAAGDYPWRIGAPPWEHRM